MTDRPAGPSSIPYLQGRAAAATTVSPTQPGRSGWPVREEGASDDGRAARLTEVSSGRVQEVIRLAEVRGPAGAGGHWPVIDEIPDPLVRRQVNDASCVSACGEMLLRDRGVDTVTQTDLLARLGSPAITADLAGVLNRLLGVREWRGAVLDVATMGGRRAVTLLSSTGSWAAELYPFGAHLAHVVVVDSVSDDDLLSIRDPFDGTSYTMKLDDFLVYWSWTAVWHGHPTERTGAWT